MRSNRTVANATACLYAINDQRAIPLITFRWEKSHWFAPSCNRILYQYQAISYLIEMVLALPTLIVGTLTSREAAALTRIEKAWRLVC
jgi:hypothetical protein